MPKMTFGDGLRSDQHPTRRPGLTSFTGLMLVLVAASFWALWIYCFNSQSNPADRLQMFKSYFPAFLNSDGALSLLSIVLCGSGMFLASLYWKEKGIVLKSVGLLTIGLGSITLLLTIFSLL